MFCFYRDYLLSLRVMDLVFLRKMANCGGLVFLEDRSSGQPVVSFHPETVLFPDLGVNPRPCV